MFWNLVFPSAFDKCLTNCGKIVPCLMQYSKKYGKWPETYVLIQHSYCHSSIWKFCYSSYHTPKLKNIVILAITFSPLISKFYQLATWNFFGLVIQIKLFCRWIETMCQLQLFLLVILLITVLLSHNVIYFEYFMPMSHGINKKAPTMPMSHGINKKAPTIVPLTLFPNRFSPDLLFYK